MRSRALGRHRAVLAGLVSLGVLLLSGCPPPTERASASAVCEKLYSQCSLGGGKLGVCDLDPSAACQTPPCLACVDQH